MNKDTPIKEVLDAPTVSPDPFLRILSGRGFPSAHAVSMCPKWFVKFYAGDFSLDDAPHLGRPVEMDHDQTETLTENNQLYTTQEINDILEMSNSSAENDLH